jgi:hypothetical protein
MMLYLRPDLVKEHKNLPSSNIELNKPFSAVKKLFKAFNEYGYLGDPSKASTEIGKQIIEETVESFFEIIKKNIEEDNFHFQIRSISWNNPLVKTNFIDKLFSIVFFSIASYFLIKNYKKNDK